MDTIHDVDKISQDALQGEMEATRIACRDSRRMSGGQAPLPSEKRRDGARDIPA